MTSLAHARQENAHLKQKLEALQLRASRTATAESRAAEANEPILQPNTERKCIFPIKHKEVWKMVRRPNPNSCPDVGLGRRWLQQCCGSAAAIERPGARSAAICACLCPLCAVHHAAHARRALRRPLANRTRHRSHRPPAANPTAASTS